MALTKAFVQSLYAAASFPDTLRAAYNQAKAASDKIALFQAGTDPHYTAILNRMSTADKQRVANIKQHLDALVAEYEANLSDFIRPQ